MLFTQGISAVKLEECDGADYTGGWFFPDDTRFPSGLAGEERLLLVLWLYGQCSKDLTGWENAGLLYKPLHFYIIFCWHYN